MAEIIIINPRFEVSYWGMEHALPFMGKRANLPIAALPLLAALTPAEHHVTLVDENVETLNFDRLVRADLVCLTGMSVQRFRMKEILTELKARGAFTIVGGPWITVQEDYFGDLVDVIFVGEAEETWPRFLDEWQRGQHLRRYEQAAKSDMTTVPTPRFDLLKMQHYLFGSVQFSRGCPFQCEFCDIIVTFGRRPRLKTSAQIIAELEALRAQKMNIAFIVDDNLIGNKKAVKVLLSDLVQYQRDNGYYFTFFTEASLDLAEDEELMSLMVDANIISVFIGIESPNDKSLKETKKLQNVRPQAGTIADRVRRIQQAGLEVWCGMILGFDSDDASIFGAQARFLQEARISSAMIGMLAAIPKTPLYARLQREGRLDLEDETVYGTNVIPLQISRDALRDGYVRLMMEVYHPDAYFDRLDDLILTGRIRMNRGLKHYGRTHPWAYVKWQLNNMVTAAGLYVRLMNGIPEVWLRKLYRQRLARLVRLRRDPSLIVLYLFKIALHYHQYTMARQMASGKTLVNSF